MKRFTLYYKGTGIQSFSTFAEMIKFIIVEGFTTKSLKYSYTKPYDNIETFDLDFYNYPKLLTHEIKREGITDSGKDIYIHYIPQTIEEKQCSTGVYDVLPLVEENDAYDIAQAEAYQNWFNENQDTIQYLSEEYLVGDIVKLSNGDFVRIKSVLRNYSIPNVGECITGIFDTKDNFHSIGDITKFQEQCCLA